MHLPDTPPPDRKKLAGPLLDVQYGRTKEKVDVLLNQLEGMCGLTFVSDGHSDKSRHPIVNYLCCAPKGSIHLGGPNTLREFRTQWDNT